MKIVSVNHINEVTTLDLSMVGAYRLCLVSSHIHLGIGLKYLTGNSFANLMLAGVLVTGLPDNDTTLAGIAKVGFQGGDLLKDKERLHDSCRILRNVINKESVVEDIAAQAEALIDFYYWIRPVLLQGSATERMEQRLGEWTTIILP